MHSKNEIELSHFSQGLSDLLNHSSTRELSGGLRCLTKEHYLSVRIVAKKGDYAELLKQKNYIDQLPSPFNQRYPKMLHLQKEGEQGILTMELIDGNSLHEVLFQQTLHNMNPIKSYSSVCESLYDFHLYSTGATVVRDARQILNKISIRLQSVMKSQVMSEIQDTLNQLNHLSWNKIEIPASLLHGDAQAGNFMITPNGTVKFIDPLGGSGQSPGDFLYDWSRMHHWVDGAGLCYEFENNSSLLFNLRANNYYKIKSDLNEITLKSVEKINKIDPTLTIDWSIFWLWSAFHITGKLTNFTSPPSQEFLSNLMLVYLQEAIKCRH